MRKSALVVIDVQNGMFLEENPVFNAKPLMDNLQSLIANARRNNIPIFYIQHNESEGLLVNGTAPWEIHSAIIPNEKDFIVQKKTPDSFYETDLHPLLQELEINHLVLAGIQTEICVDTTCRNAYSLGYEITLAEDAHSTWDSNELTAKQIIHHHNQVLRWFAELKETKKIIFI